MKSSPAKLAYDAAYRASHREERRAHDAAYFQENREAIRERQTRYRETHREECKAACAKWRREHPKHISRYRAEHREEKKASCATWVAEHTDAVAGYRAMYRERNPEKTVAHNAVNHAIESGKLSRGPCEVCGTMENIHGHHGDYSSPLDVQWLCREHHHSIHRELP